jgi:hypothetical protein
LILPARLSIPTRLSAPTLSITTRMNPLREFTTAAPESDARRSHQSQIDISLVRYRKERKTGVSVIYRYPMFFGPVSSIAPGTGPFFCFADLCTVDGSTLNGPATLREAEGFAKMLCKG